MMGGVEVQGTREEFGVGLMKIFALAGVVVLGMAAALASGAQGALDPARALPLGREQARALLPEEYIWTAGDAMVVADGAHPRHHDKMEKLDPHYFRTEFVVGRVPKQATLYVAGPRKARVWVNGRLVEERECNPQSWLIFETLMVDVSAALRPGRNVLAVEAVRGWGHSHHTNHALTRQVMTGEVVAAKIVPAGVGVEARPLAISSKQWRSVARLEPGWEQAGFDDSRWPRVQSLGGIESSDAFYQWHVDAGLINWPGYVGVSSRMRRYRLLPKEVAIPAAGGARFEGIENLRSDAGKDAVVRLPETASPAETPSLLLDFGKEVAGRVLLVSGGGTRTATVDVSYGESKEEVLGGPFLKTQRLYLAPEGIARGVKSGFRYVLLRFPDVKDEVRIRSAALEGIAYPVRYRGSFTSSDERVNRIWETAAYTAHLSLQEGIWDGVKRDRGKWMGDMDVAARVADAIFADGGPNQRTLLELAGRPPYDEPVNGIPTYTAFWVMGVAAHERRLGSRADLEAVREPLKGLLKTMETNVDGAGLFANPAKKTVFVDWATNFDRDTPEARRAAQFEYLLAFREGAAMLDKLGEGALAAKYRALAERMREAAEQRLKDTATGTFGPYWQTSAMAIVSGGATAEESERIYGEVLSGVGGGVERMQWITPYYGYYVLEALARTGHVGQGLDWLRQYWGGMLDEGATSFWEAYDPRWPKNEPHKYLQADHKMGYYVSLAHGWSSGPALWLIERVAGLQAEGPGRFVIRPELGDLQWVKASLPVGAEEIGVEVRREHGLRMTVRVPKGCRARVELPGKFGAARVNGRPVRGAIVLEAAGRYAIEAGEGGF
jgi:alpha-L-rhamnosidase